MPLLSVMNLTTCFHTSEGTVRAVDGVSFSLDRGESLGIVGESGCGKTVLALSLMRLVPEPGGVIEAGSAWLSANGAPSVDLMKLPEREMRRIRGKRIAMVFQEPMTALNPLFPIGDQIGEAIALHDGLRGKGVRQRTIEMLQLVGMPAPDQRVDEYPHQLSGGMRQRAMIAMALVCKPDILIADEPTTALDVTIQAQIIELIKRIQQQLGMALLLITHDLGVIAEVASRVLVMYAGRGVEEGSVEEVFSRPRHPYTQGLLNSIPLLTTHPRRSKLATIPGAVPQLSHLPRGCAFQDRCPKVQPRCREEEVPDDPCGTGRLVRCFYA